jgi:hypothetical protein
MPRRTGLDLSPKEPAQRLAALQRVPQGAGVSRWDARAGIRCSGSAGSSRSHHDADARSAMVAVDVAPCHPAYL